MDSALDFRSEGDESSFDVARVEGRGFDELDSEGISEFLAFLEGDLTLALEIVLVTDEELDHVLVSVLVGFLEPVVDVLEGLHVGDVVHDDDAVRTFIVRRGNRLESFLTSGVPDL